MRLYPACWVEPDFSHIAVVKTVLLADLLLGITLGICCYTDLRWRRIPNAVVLPSIATAVAWHFLHDGIDGLIASGWGILFGAAILFLPFATGGMGAGDVKLMAAVGAWKGVVFAVYVLLLGALAGGLVALLIVIRHGQIRATAGKIWNGIVAIMLFRFRLNSFAGHSATHGEAIVTIPYGALLALGAALTWFLEVWG